MPMDDGLKKNMVEIVADSRTNLNSIFNTSISVAEKFFPAANNTSYQPLTTRTGDIPIIVLAHVFIGLIGFIILVNYGHYNTSGLQLLAFGALTFITIRVLWTLETTQRFILIPLGFTAGLSERVVLNIKKLSGSNLDRKKLNILIDKIREIHE